MNTKNFIFLTAVLLSIHSSHAMKRPASDLSVISLDEISQEDLSRPAKRLKTIDSSTQTTSSPKKLVQQTLSCTSQKTPTKSVEIERTVSELCVITIDEAPPILQRSKTMDSETLSQYKNNQLQHNPVRPKILIVPAKKTLAKPVLQRNSSSEDCIVLDEKPLNVKNNQPVVEIQSDKPLFVQIKKGISEANPSIIDSLFLEETELTWQEKVYLHALAKQQKTDLSYTKNIDAARNISRHLNTFKHFPNLSYFPHTIFTPTPLCDYSKQYGDPRPKPSDALIALCKNEKQKISVCCYHITLNKLIQTLIKKKKEGVEVEVITDQDQTKESRHSKGIKELNAHDIPVLSPLKYREQMHHKFFIFHKNVGDKKLVSSGSYNLTPFSNSHSWDDMTVSDHPRTIKQFEGQYKTVKEYSAPLFKQNQLT